MVQYDQICLQQRCAKIAEENEVNDFRGNLQSLGEEFSETTKVEEVEKILSELDERYAATIKHWVSKQLLLTREDQPQSRQNLSKKSILAQYPQEFHFLQNRRRRPSKNCRDFPVFATG